MTPTRRSRFQSPMVLANILLCASFAHAQEAKPERAITVDTISNLNCVAFTPDGKSFAVGAYTSQKIGQILVYDTKSGEKRQTLELGEGGAVGMFFSDDGKELTVGATYSHVKIWETRSWKEKYAWKAVDGEKFSIFSMVRGTEPNSLAFGSSDRILICDAETGKVLRRIETSGIMNRIALTKDGKSVIIAPSKKDAPGVVVYDVETGKHRMTIPLKLVSAIALSADDRQVIVATGDDLSIRYFDLETGKEAKSIANVHTKAAIQIVLSPDGKSFATGSLDGSVKVWKAADGKCIRTIAAHSSKVNTVVFSPDGKRLVTTATPTLKVWSMP